MLDLFNMNGALKYESFDRYFSLSYLLNFKYKERDKSYFPTHFLDKCIVLNLSQTQPNNKIFHHKI